MEKQNPPEKNKLQQKKITIKNEENNIIRINNKRIETKQELKYGHG